jgi:hypothetical protein
MEKAHLPEKFGIEILMRLLGNHAPTVNLTRYRVGRRDGF